MLKFLWFFSGSIFSKHYKIVLNITTKKVSGQLAVCSEIGIYTMPQTLWPSYSALLTKTPCCSKDLHRWLIVHTLSSCISFSGWLELLAVPGVKHVHKSLPYWGLKDRFCHLVPCFTNSPTEINEATCEVRYYSVSKVGSQPLISLSMSTGAY